MYKFLLIEDSASDIDAFETSIKRLNAEEMRYQLETASSYEEGLAKVNGAYNGVIVDINFDGDDENDGNTLIREIVKQFAFPLLSSQVLLPIKMMDPQSECLKKVKLFMMTSSTNFVRFQTQVYSKFSVERAKSKN